MVFNSVSSSTIHFNISVSSLSSSKMKLNPSVDGDQGGEDDDDSLIVTYLCMEANGASYK